MATSTALQLKNLALDCGFSHTSELDIASLKPQAEVREACAADKCGSYAKSWSCPPACGTLEKGGQRISLYTQGLLLQTTGNLEDSFDYEGMKKTGNEHNAHLLDFRRALAESSLPSTFLLLGSGPCPICPQCSYPDSACRFPGEAIISMEAMGLAVSEVCAANNLPYYYGPNTISFTGCLLFSKDLTQRRSGAELAK